jgi:hypothetical protein
LKKILTKWISVNPTDYLFCQTLLPKRSKPKKDLTLDSVNYSADGVAGLSTTIEVQGYDAGTGYRLTFSQGLLVDVEVLS